MSLKNLSRTLRRNQTDAEIKLWNQLKNRHVDGHKFRRQHRIGPYIVDFACLKRHLVIELDGGRHGDEQKSLQDRERTRWLEDEGYRVIRFWNNDVLANVDGVLETIQQNLADGHPHPTLLPSREKETPLSPPDGKEER